MIEQTLCIESPAHVEVRLLLASAGNRFLACAIDHGLQMLATALVSTLSYALGGNMLGLGGGWGSVAGAAQPLALGALLLLNFLISTGYFIFFETRWEGQTPGKRWFGLRVIHTDGAPLGFSGAVIRNLLRMADLVPPPFYGVGLVVLFASPHSQRLGDLAADTVVIKEPPFDELEFVQILAASEDIDPATRRVAPAVDFRADLKSVTLAEAQVIASFLSRRYELPAQRRAQLAWRITAPLLDKIKPEYEEENFNSEGFLEELLARLRALHQS